MNNEEKPSHVDLFSGIGGFSLASHWAGFETIAFCEKDNWCQQVIRKHWPDVPIHGDIKSFPGELYRGADLLTGGFPCQPFAQCGKRKGKDDDRYLWPQMLKVINDIKPSWIVAENVPNIIKMALPTVIADLAKSGYESSVLLLPAHGVGAPHRRRRAYVVAKSFNSNRNGIGSYREEVYQNRQGCGPELQDEQERQLRPMVSSQVWERIDPRVLRVADGIPDRVDRLKGIGNAIVPQVAFEILNMIYQLIKKE